MSKFELGQVVMTRTINDTIADNEQFAKDIVRAMSMYKNADFSDMEYQEDIEMNYEAIRTGEDRIFATYNTCGG